MIPFTKKEQKMHNKQKVCHICKKIFSTDDNNKKYCHKTIVIILENTEGLPMISAI